MQVTRSLLAPRQRFVQGHLEASCATIGDSAAYDDAPLFRLAAKDWQAHPPHHTYDCGVGDLNFEIADEKTGNYFGLCKWRLFAHGFLSFQMAP